jgi:soluble cytochrome b562
MMRHGWRPIVLALAAVVAGPAEVRWAADRAVLAMQAQDAGTDAGVRDTLQKYSAALESLDANAVKKVQPSVPVDNLARAFKEMRELKVQIDEVRVLSTAGATARVSCRVTQMLTPRAGSRQTTAVTRVMRFRRESEAWVIDGFER